MKKIYLAAILLLGLQVALSAQINCNDDESTVVVTINTDGFGAETSWMVIDNQTNMIYDSIVPGFYPNTMTTHVHEFCIPQDACVTFIIRDSFGDGICCGNFGDGSYEVTLDAVVVASGGDFAHEECTQIYCSPGMGCTSAVPIIEGSHTTETTDYWYEFAPTEAGLYVISTCDLNNCNTKIWVYDDCDNCIYSEDNDGTLAYNDYNTECGFHAMLNIPMGPPNVYYIRIGDAVDNCEDLGSLDWTLTYEGPITGCTDPEACNYNPLATVSDPESCIYEGNSDCPAPDLTISETALFGWNVPMDVDEVDADEDICLVSEGCLNGYGVREVIRFTTRIENIGELDYIIGAASDTTDQFTYDNCHDHYHYDGYAEYLMYDDDGVELPIGFKNGFCVLDLGCPPDIDPQYTTCQYMGITAGCTDTYQHSLECQWIDITDVEDGTYILVARVNWDNAPDLLGRYESDFSNNWAQACINIHTETDGTRDFNIVQNCEPYVDCAGEVYGSAQPDCTGVCDGGTLMGDLNADGIQAMEDAQNYVTQILGNDITPNTCNDLNADEEINVYDAALLASCLNYGTAHEHPETNAHDHCEFPMGLTNPNDLVTLSISDVNFANKYIDIEVDNPDNSINAYQFTMSGIEIMTVENLVNPEIYPITPSTVPGGNMVIGISYEDSLIVKSNVIQPLCRIHYSEITNDEICIASVISVVNQDYEETLTEIGGFCIDTIVGIDSPFTVIEANITPNPTKGDALLTFPNTTNETFALKITDATGRIIRIYETLNGNQHIIERGNLANGVYLYHLQSGTKTATGKLVIQD